MTAREVAARAVEVLRAAGSAQADASIDVDVLVRHVLGWDRATLLLRRDETVPPAAQAEIERLVDRRAGREPVAYLTGTREFYGRPFAVSSAVLIPRPETELVVDAVLARTPPDAPLHIVDVCTGSGILAVTLAAERPAARVTASDISRPALAVAHNNASTHGVRQRLALVEADLLCGLAGPFDVIVANPPYVRRGDAPGLSRDVRNFEPAVALFGGDDGLEVLTRLLAESTRRLAPGGLFVMEFGAGQQYDVAHRATHAGFEVEDVLDDLQGIARVLVCRL